MDSPVLAPFTETERHLLQHAFKTLADTNFFERYIQMKTLEEIASFDSRSADEKLLAIERLSGVRSSLLYLGMESKRIAESIEAIGSESLGEQTGDSYEFGTPLFPYLESQ
jgi:hypothetical protein